MSGMVGIPQGRLGKYKTGKHQAIAPSTSSPRSAYYRRDLRHPLTAHPRVNLERLT
jgi:hypothetical protein